MPGFVISSLNRFRIWVFIVYLDLENFLKFFLGTKCTYVCMGVSKFFKSITKLGEPRIRTQLVETNRNMGLYVMRGQGEVDQCVAEPPIIYYY